MSCPTCGGLGWVYLTESAQIRWVGPEPEPVPDPFEASRLRSEFRDRQAKGRNMVYPCRDCNPRAFYTWSGGHWDPNHDTAACDECAARLPERYRHHVRQEVDAVASTSTYARDFTEPTRNDDDP